MLTDEIRELIDAFSSSIFDPDPIVFSSRNGKGVLRIRNAVLRNPPGITVHFRKTIPRNAFLNGCHALTEHFELEHLIVGYGRKSGRTTNITGLDYAIGDKTSVNPSDAIKNRVDTHLRKAAKNEVIVFHNHPTNWVNNLFDNLPVASSTDRVTLLKGKYLEPVILFKTILGKGSIRFYVGENARVREYNTPNVLGLLSFLGKRSYGR